MKTRLIGALTPEQAAALHEAFVGDLSERLLGGDFALWIAWALDPDEPLPASDLPSVRQRGADLGERLYRALADAACDYRWVAAVGSDHPELPLERVHEAFAALEAGRDLVLGPAQDGGYYLIAARAAVLDPELFRGIAWSTGGVLTETLARCRRLGLDCHLLAAGDDVDRPEDLERLARSLAGSESGCPRTRAVLAGVPGLPGGR